ncbi:hypothetical protein PCL_04311 [Purpureocillium lilacinum]|uniref:V-type proton ATPase proteolipid subunit n=1 Tax=Purpureocillium lilacinum TaxID=33203 RepID=A0A2U3DY12_PURLI|nr:hypothetical protein PCL_04311 [Purpureocillium lilacinum]
MIRRRDVRLRRGHRAKNSHNSGAKSNHWGRADTMAAGVESGSRSTSCAGMKHTIMPKVAYPAWRNVSAEPHLSYLASPTRTPVRAARIADLLLASHHVRHGYWSRSAEPHANETPNRLFQCTGSNEAGLRQDSAKFGHLASVHGQLYSGDSRYARVSLSSPSPTLSRHGHEASSLSATGREPHCAVNGPSDGALRLTCASKANVNWLGRLRPLAGTSPSYVRRQSTLELSPASYRPAKPTSYPQSHRETRDIALTRSVRLVLQSFFGAMGCATAIVFSTFGASYGTAKSAVAIFASGVLRPDRLMQNVLCAIMAQILSIYGLVISVIIANQIYEKMPIYTGFLQLGAGLSVGLCGLAAGFAIGIVGDCGGAQQPPPLRASTQQPRLYVGMVLILIFAEVLGLYGGVVAVMMYSRATQGATVCKY